MLPDSCTILPTATVMVRLRDSLDVWPRWLDSASAATARPRAVDATPTRIAVSAASGALIDAICRLLALLDAPDDAAALAAGVEREVLWRILTGPQGTTVRQIGLADSRLAHLARAIHWIRSPDDHTLRVEQLAARARLGVARV